METQLSNSTKNTKYHTYIPKSHKKRQIYGTRVEQRKFRNSIQSIHVILLYDGDKVRSISRCPQSTTQSWQPKSSFFYSGPPPPMVWSWQRARDRLHYRQGVSQVSSDASPWLNHPAETYEFVRFGIISLRFTAMHLLDTKKSIVCWWCLQWGCFLSWEWTFKPLPSQHLPAI